MKSISCLDQWRSTKTMDLCSLDAPKRNPGYISFFLKIPSLQNLHQCCHALHVSKGIFFRALPGLTFQDLSLEVVCFQFQI